MGNGILLLLGLALALSARVAGLTAQQPPPPLVSAQEILDGLTADGSRWLTFGGNYSNQRHSPLTQITPANVNRLVLSGPSRRAHSEILRRLRSSVTTSFT